MPSTKYVGLSYPTHFLKSRGSVIRNNFLQSRTNKATHFKRRNDFYALLLRHIAGQDERGEILFENSFRR